MYSNHDLSDKKKKRAETSYETCGPWIIWNH